MRAHACVAVALLALAAGAGRAAAAPTLSITVGPDPVESITTQLGVAGTATASDNQLFLTVKPAGGQACGANAQADGGTSLLSFTTVGSGPFSTSRNWTSDAAASYLACAWMTDNTQSGDPVVASASSTVTVRQPHLALSIAAPGSVRPGRVFQVVTTAQAEAQRTVFEYMVSDTGRGCPANGPAAASDASSQQVLGYWDVEGGPFARTVNLRLDATGRYLLCAYFDYGALTPEATASASVTAEYPCVVPRRVAGRSLASVKRRIRGAHCRVGAIRRVASRRYRRGRVVALGIAAGSVRPGGTAVGITVSSGPPRRRRRRHH